MCGAVSILSGETAVKRRSACIVYVEPNGKRVEQCGSGLSRSPNAVCDHDDARIGIEYE